MDKQRCRGWKPAGKIAVLTILIAASTGSGRAMGGQPGTAITLREWKRAGATTRVQTELKAKGLYRPGLPPGGGSGEVKMPKPLVAEIETRFIYHERIVEVDTNQDHRQQR